MIGVRVMLRVLPKKIALVALLTVIGYGQQAQAKNDDIDDLRFEKTNEWYLVKDDQHHDIQTWAKREDGKQIRSFKVRSEIKASVEEVMKVFLDFDNWKRWSWKVRISKLLKKVSATEYYAYVTHDSPFGVPDRDVILHFQIDPYSPNHTYIGISIDAVPNYIPVEPNFVRIEAESLRIKIYSDGNGKTVFENEGYVDPASGMPIWSINFIQRTAPYTIMLGLKRRVENHLYNDNFVVPFATK